MTLKSMTGFGRGEYKAADFSFAVEIKTVNHRYNEFAVRLPRFLNPVEDRLRKKISQAISRGRIDVFVNAAYTGQEACQVQVDTGLVQAYQRALHEVQSAAGLAGSALPPLSEVMYLAKCPEVINVQEGSLDLEALWPKMEGALEQALATLVQMRTTEGANMCADLSQRVDLIEQKLALVEERAPQVVTEYETRARERISELLQQLQAGQLDQERLLQEVAIFADRVSITEEIVRLHSHIKQFRTMLESTQPIGRKLDFLVQEFNREANTMASKANDSALTQIVVDIKAEIEKIREQIQNIE